ncbi:MULTISPECIES: hypothetical protein [unclassified Sphingomonas]|uniref:hypothetical protein n=1 Tax=unclassified Sphingomonas TaxID=196159 RepID=UPI0006F3C054|nr:MULTISPECIES: hypothetical protein [unclassified Sphingomonas]KQM26458.1 hypothetical protein ASE58_12110 [Sphingomonas sp. Leaf9]KQM42867.1 hypothetical protein ASE57_12115 [Sphingomonas sp. Leaf11]
MYAMLVLLGQVATPAVPLNAPPERISILVDPCVSRRRNSQDDEIVVCGEGARDPRLPLPGERTPPDRPLASNPYADGRGAALAAADPCATRSEGCTTGVDMIGGGVFAIRAIGKLIDPGSCCEEPGEYKDVGKLVGDIIRGVKGGPSKKERAKRVAIPLDPAVPLPIAAK